MAVVVLSLLFLFRNSYQKWYQLWRWRSLDSRSAGKIPRKLWVFNIQNESQFNQVSEEFGGMEINAILQGSRLALGENRSDTAQAPLVSLLQAAAGRNQRVLLDLHTDEAVNDSLLTLAVDGLPVDKGHLVLEIYQQHSANVLAGKGYTVAINVGGKLMEQSADSLARFKAGLHPGIRYVCEEAYHYKDFKQWFPEYQVITWALGKDYLVNMDRLKTFLDDPTIDAVVVDMKTSPF